MFEAVLIVLVSRMSLSDDPQNVADLRSALPCRISLRRRRYHSSQAGDQYPTFAPDLSHFPTFGHHDNWVLVGTFGFGEAVKVQSVIISIPKSIMISHRTE